MGAVGRVMRSPIAPYPEGRKCQNGEDSGCLSANYCYVLITIITIIFTHHLLLLLLLLLLVVSFSL